MRLGDKSITQDARRLRVLLPPGGAAAAATTPYGAPIACYDSDGGTFVDRNDGTFLFRITTSNDYQVIGMGQTFKSAPIAYVIFGNNSAATGNVYCNLSVTHYHAESTTFTAYNTGFQAIAIGGSSPNWYWYKPAALALTVTNAVSGDIIRFIFRRAGTNVSDTFSGSIDVLGFVLDG
jgi:hypothetical protein